MRTLYLTLRSPFARKVSIALAEKGLAHEPVVVDLANRSAAFVAVSPIGKVPVLVDEDGTVVLDSTGILEYLEDRYPTPPLLPGGWQERLAVRTLEELGDALAEQAITVFFGRQRQDTAAVTKAEANTGRILAALETRANPEGAPLCGTFSAADAAVVSALGYQTFRCGDGWRTAHPTLAAWFDRMDERPSAAATRPKG